MNKPLMIGEDSPWGPIQTCDSLLIGSGIKHITTASHGGIYVPDGNLHHIPIKHQEYAEQWSGSRNFYEEDVAWACVAVAFPEMFSKVNQILAKKIVAVYIENEDQS